MAGIFASPLMQVVVNFSNGVFFKKLTLPSMIIWEKGM